MKLYGIDYEVAEQIARNLGISCREYEELMCTRKAGKFCLHCNNRLRGRGARYCLMQPSKLSKNGYRRVKAHDDACGLYKERRFV